MAGNDGEGRDEAGERGGERERVVRERERWGRLLR
jgi:hypothetical protein